MNVSHLFVLDSFLSAERPGQTCNSPHLMASQLPLRIINGELVFYIRKGTWGGGAYYLEGAGCMWGNTVYSYGVRLTIYKKAYSGTQGPVDQEITFLIFHMCIDVDTRDLS